MIYGGGLRNRGIFRVVCFLLNGLGVEDVCVGLGNGKSKRNIEMMGRQASVLRIFVVLILGVMMSGCGTLLSSDRQYLAVDTGEIEGARCSVVDDQARQWFVEQTPGRIIIDRGATSFTVACSYPGYRTAVRQVDGSYSGLLLLNAWPFLSSLAVTGNNIYTLLLQGGLSLAGVGADVANGRHITLPQKVSVPMIRPSSAVEQGLPGPLSPSTVAPAEEGQRLLEQEQDVPLSPYDELILDTGKN